MTLPGSGVKTDIAIRMDNTQARICILVQAGAFGLNSAAIVTKHTYNNGLVLRWLYSNVCPLTL